MKTHQRSGFTWPNYFSSAQRFIPMFLQHIVVFFNYCSFLGVISVSSNAPPLHKTARHNYLKLNFCSPQNLSQTACSSTLNKEQVQKILTQKGGFKQAKAQR